MSNYNDQYDAKLFEAFTDWKFHDGSDCPIEPTKLVKVMYSSGVISPYIRPAGAYLRFIADRNWWSKADGLVHIIAYVVI